MRRGTMSPLLIGVPRTTDHLSRRRILRWFWDQKFLEEKVVTILPRSPSWSAKPYSLGKVTHLTRIQFAIKVENLWKNPITCSGNTFEEGDSPSTNSLSKVGDPLRESQSLAEGNPPVGEALSRRQSLPLRRSRCSDTVLWGEGDCWGEGVHMMKPEEVHHMGRTLWRSETDSHRGLEPHVAEPNSGSCWWVGPCWC